MTYIVEGTMNLDIKFNIEAENEKEARRQAKLFYVESAFPVNLKIDCEELTGDHLNIDTCFKKD